MKRFIIDANNVLHKHPLWRKVVAETPGAARTALVEALVPYARRYPSYRFLLVFDGESNTNAALPTAIRAVSASGGRTADDLIRAEIRAERSPDRCVVVSSDTEVYNSARAHACTAMTSEEFLREISPGSPAKGSGSRGGSGGEKPSGVSRAEIAAMKKLFGLE